MTTTEFLYYSALAAEFHAILWWHVWPDGTYQPLLQPVDDRTWRLIVQ